MRTPASALDDAARSGARLGCAYLMPLPQAPQVEQAQAALLRACGWEVQRCTLRHLLFEGGVAGLMRRRNLVVVQGLERLAFRAAGDGNSDGNGSGAGLRPSLRGLLRLGFHLGLLGAASACRVAVVHERWVPGTTGLARRLSAALVRLCAAVSDHRVVHDPASAPAWRAQALPPLPPWEGVQDAATPGRPPGVTRVARRAAGAPWRCVLLAPLRPARALDAVLRHWPAQQALTVSGEGTPEQTLVLRAWLMAAGLAQTVSLQPASAQAPLADGALRDADVLLLHEGPQAALVDARLIEALGRVPWIVARRTPFVDAVAARVDGVLPYDDEAQLPALLASLGAGAAAPSSPTAPAAGTPWSPRAETAGPAVVTSRVGTWVGSAAAAAVGRADREAQAQSALADAAAQALQLHGWERSRLAWGQFLANVMRERR